MADLGKSAEKFFQALIVHDMGLLMGAFTLVKLP